MKKILILGSSGYVGSYISPKLSKTNLVTGIDKETNVNCKSFYKINIIDNFKKFSKVAKNYEILIILAGIVGDPNCFKYKDEAKKINVDFLKELKKNIHKFENLKKIIFTSSCSVYGFGRKEFKEKSKFNPLSYYSKTKIQGEKILLEIKQKISADIYILRLSTLYGYSPSMRFDLVPNLFIKNIKDKKLFTIYGGDQIRPFISLKFLGNVILKIISQENYNNYFIYNL